MRRNLVGILLAATLVALAPTASAIYIVTPLHLEASNGAIEVGETIDLRIYPENETTAAEWRGKLVKAYYAYGETEGEEYRRVLIDDALALDDGAEALFTWTAPAQVDDHNVQILVENDAGELLAVTDVAVGDAPPVMRALASENGLAEGEPVPEEGVAPSDETAAKDVPAAGLIAAVAALGVAGLTLRRRA